MSDFSGEAKMLLDQFGDLDDKNLTHCQAWMNTCIGLLRAAMGENHPTVHEVAQAAAPHIEPRLAYRRSTPNNRRRALDSIRSLLLGALAEHRLRDATSDVRIKNSSVSGNILIGSSARDVISSIAPPTAARAGAIFVSYLRQDIAVVNSLVAALRSAGVDVWIDQDGIKAGDLWKERITEAIETGGAFLACFSKNFEQRPNSYMRTELAFAIEHAGRMVEQRRWLLPVRLDDAAVPALTLGSGAEEHKLTDLHIIDWFGDPVAALGDIIGALR